MSVVVATVVPVFALIAIGFLASRSGYVSDAAAKGLPEFVFRIAMPVMLVYTIGRAKPPSISAGLIILAFFGAIAFVWLLATVVTRWPLVRPAADAPALAMAATFSNGVIIGIPIVMAHFGPEAAPVIAIIILCDVPLLWLAGTLHLAAVEERAMGGPLQLAANLTSRLATNPIILATLVGLLVQVSGFSFPPVAERAVTLLAGAATPGALVAMGLSLNGYSLKGEVGSVVLMTLLKLVVLPAAVWWIAGSLLGLPPLVVGVLVVMAAMPVGANAFLFASAYDRAPAAVSGAIALSTPLALATVSALLVMLPGVSP